MFHRSTKHEKPQHAGLRLRAPARYDLAVWLLTWGQPRRFRERMLKPAKLKRGEGVLDVSCGTGSLALLAKEQVGPEGRVHGIDASEEMIAYARKKASSTGTDVAFDVAPAQQLPFNDASFDVVLNTLALHHLPKASRYQAFGEIRRVLKAGGRALIEDFAEGEKRSRGLLGRLKHRHGSVPPDEMASAMRCAGFAIAATGSVGTKSLHFVLGSTPRAQETVEPALLEEEPIPKGNPRRALFPLGAAALVLLVFAHTAIAASFGAAVLHGLSNIGWKAIGAIGAVLLVVKIASHVLFARTAWRRSFQRQD